MILTRDNVNQVAHGFAVMQEVFAADAPAETTFPLEMIERRIREFGQAMKGQSSAEQTKALHMRLTLGASVPFAVHDLHQQGGPTLADIDFCQEFALRIGSQADRLQYRSRGEWVGEGEHRHYQYSTAELMAQMIRAVAIMAFFPGGITFLGLHFEAVPLDREAVFAPARRAPVRFRRQHRGRRR